MIKHRSLRKIFSGDGYITIQKTEDLLRLLNSHTTIFAAGGIVFNERSEILMIFRHGLWDFPKGKVEPDETFEEAAMREVTEETGIADLQIIKKLPVTYHTYVEGKCNMFKQTFWFKMKTTSQHKPTPQLEEDIEFVQWVNIDRVAEHLSNSYLSLQELWRVVF